MVRLFLACGTSRVLRREHPGTLSGRIDLAEAYRGLGHYGDAVALDEETVPAMERVLGPQHPWTLTSRSNLSINYRALGRSQEAVALWEETLRVTERVLGPEHPDTLGSRNNLAVGYRAPGRHEEADRLEHPESIGPTGCLPCAGSHNGYTRFGPSAPQPRCLDAHRPAPGTRCELLGDPQPNRPLSLFDNASTGTPRSMKNPSRLLASTHCRRLFWWLDATRFPAPRNVRLAGGRSATRALSRDAQSSVGCSPGTKTKSAPATP